MPFQFINTFLPGILNTTAMFNGLSQRTAKISTTYHKCGQLVFLQGSKSLSWTLTEIKPLSSLPKVVAQLSLFLLLTLPPVAIPKGGNQDVTYKLENLASGIRLLYTSCLSALTSHFLVSASSHAGKKWDWYHLGTIEVSGSILRAGTLCILFMFTLSY